LDSELSSRFAEVEIETIGAVALAGSVRLRA
jgi:hypothetical protein